MQRKSNAVVFIGMTYPYGAIRHFALLGCELFKGCQDDVDFYFASIAREPDKGCWDIVRQTIPNEHVIKTDTFEELVRRCCDLAKIYDKVVVHTGGGWGQTKHFVPARKRMDKMLQERLIIIGTTHSYRHDSFLRIPMSAFQYVLYRLYYRMIIFQCQYAADRFIGGNHLIKIGKGAVIPLGCEPFGEIGNDIPKGIAENASLSVILKDCSLFKFVYLAAFRPGKMHVWLVYAISPVLRQHPEGRLLLCGTGSERVRADIVRAIEAEKMEGQIILTGQINRHEVPWLLAHSNCAVVPSRSETFGHNFLEPMFAGLPVLGTSVGVGRDIIKDGENGYKFSLNEINGFRDKATKLIRKPKRAKQFGIKAKALVEKRFTHEAVARKLWGVYRRVLGLPHHLTMDEVEKGSIVMSQHYVQRAYLKAWTDEKGLIASADVKGKIFSTSVEGVSAENYFYSFQCLSLEEFKWLVDFITAKEGIAMDVKFAGIMLQATIGTAILNDVLNNEQANYDEIKRVVDYGSQRGVFEEIFCNMISHAIMIRRVGANLDQEHRELSERLCMNGAEKLMCEIENGAIEPLSFVRTMKDNILRNKDFSFRLYKYMMYQIVRGPKFYKAFEGSRGKLDASARRRIASYVRYFMAESFIYRLKDWYDTATFFILKNRLDKTANAFVTGDCPVINIASDTTKDLDIYWPISPSCALLLTSKDRYDDYYKKRYGVLDFSAIDVLNRRICANCVRNVHALSGIQLKQNGYFPSWQDMSQSLKE